MNWFNHKKDKPSDGLDLLNGTQWASIPQAKEAKLKGILKKLQQENWLLARKKIYAGFTAQEMAKSAPLPSVLDKRFSAWGKNKAFDSYVRSFDKDSVDKFRIAGMVCCMCATLVFYFAKAMVTGQYLVGFSVDALVGVMAIVLLLRNVQLKYGLTSEYTKAKDFLYLDLLAVLLCTLFKIWLPAGFDVSLIILVVTYFIEKRKFAYAVQLLQDEILPARSEG